MNIPIAILIVLGAAAVAALPLALLRRRAGGPLLADGGRGGPKIIVTGTLFAVVLAFVILSAFETYKAPRRLRSPKPLRCSTWRAPRLFFRPPSATSYTLLLRATDVRS